MSTRTPLSSARRGETALFDGATLVHTARVNPSPDPSATLEMRASSMQAAITSSAGSPTALAVVVAGAPLAVDLPGQVWLEARCLTAKDSSPGSGLEGAAE
jgi:hypothetical protein